MFAKTGKILLSAAILFAGILYCGKNPVAGGTGTGNAVVGKLYESDGTTPAKGAKVYLIPIDHNPRQGLPKTAAAAPQSTETDDKGNYKIDSVPAGTYNILASGGGNLAYEDSIVKKADTQTIVPADTLKSPGSIRGVVRLQPGDNAKKVFIIALGTNTFSSPEDSVGNFALADMAEGKYKVRIMSILDNYGVLDTSLEIRAGKSDSLADTIGLPYTGIPVPTGLKISYDTLKQIVTLSWNKPSNGRKVASYSIYRKQIDSTDFVKIKGGVTDTVFSDSTGVQDQTHEYRVAVVDANATEGTKSAGVSINFVGVFKLWKKLDINISSKLGGLFVDSNTIINVEVESQIVKMDDDGVTLKAMTLRNSLNVPIQDLRDLSVDKNGNYYVIAHNGSFKFDSTGIFLSQFDTVKSGTGVALSDSFIFVVFSHAIRKFTIEGQFVAQWADVEGMPGYLKSAAEIYLVNDSLFVFDELNAKMQIYNTNGKFLGDWGSSGDKDGSFIPGGNARFIIDNYGFAIVTQGAKTQIFTKDGKYIGKMFTGIINSGPSGIAMDKANNLYLANGQLQPDNSMQYSILIYKIMVNYK